jgi:hypothetical protein
MYPSILLRTVPTLLVKGRLLPAVTHPRAEYVLASKEVRVHTDT